MGPDDLFVNIYMAIELLWSEVSQWMKGKIINEFQDCIIIQADKKHHAEHVGNPILDWYTN